MNGNNNLKDSIPASVMDAVTALLKPYGVDFAELLTSSQSASSASMVQHSTRGYCNAKNAAKYLGVSAQTLWRMVQSGLIHSHGASNYDKRYSYDELDLVLANRNNN